MGERRYTEWTCDRCGAVAVQEESPRPPEGWWERPENDGPRLYCATCLAPYEAMRDRHDAEIAEFWGAGVRV